eukprot:3854853-Amphidinium_carterae.1
MSTSSSLMRALLPLLPAASRQATVSLTVVRRALARAAWLDPVVMAANGELRIAFLKKGFV